MMEHLSVWLEMLALILSVVVSLAVLPWSEHALEETRGAYRAVWSALRAPLAQVILEHRAAMRALTAPRIGL